MPTLGASLVATAAGWLLEGLLEPMLGLGAAWLLSFVGSAIAFFVARKWFIDLRDGSL